MKRKQSTELHLAISACKRSVPLTQADETLIHSPDSAPERASASSECASGSLSPSWSYRDQVVLAPMVRIGKLPFRALCAEVSVMYSPLS